MLEFFKPLLDFSETKYSIQQMLSEKNTDNVKMVISLVIGFSFILLALSVRPALSGELESGASISGELNSAVFQELHTFFAEEGDTIVFSLSIESLMPWVTVTSPSGVELWRNTPFSSYEFLENLPETGVYSFDVSGNVEEPLIYSVNFLRVGQSTEFDIESGSVIEGDMPEYDFDTYSFVSKAGQYFVMSFESSEEDHGEYNFELYSPTGVHLTDEFSDQRDYFGHLGNRMFRLKALPEDGRYTLLIQGDQGEAVGDYKFSFGLSGAEYPVHETISSNHESDYTIDASSMGLFGLNAKQGESIFLRLGSDMTYLSMALFAPDGSLISTSLDINSSYDEIQAFDLEQSGRYTIMVVPLATTSEPDGESGPYVLNFHKAPGDGDGTLSPGQEKQSSLLQYQLDSFQFTAQAGDTVRFHFSKENAMWAKIFDPNGTTVEEERIIDGFRVSGIEAIDLAQSGNYTIMVKHDYVQSGDYSILFERISNGLRSGRPECKQPFGNCNQSIENSGVMGNPINFAYGFKAQMETDFAAGNLHFTRYYRSNSDWTNDTLGDFWRHNYFRKLSFINKADGARLMEITDGRGAVGSFQFDNGSWVNQDPDVPTRFDAILEGEQVNGYIYTTASDTQEFYSPEGLLQRIDYISGQVIELDYDDQKLTKIKDQYGIELTLGYDAQGRVNTLNTPDGNYAYAYENTNNNLISVTKPDDTTRQYHYEDERFPNALTGITDENEKRYATYTYDEEGRAYKSEHADGVNTFTADYSVENQVTVTNPLGKKTVYNFETIQGLKKIVSVEGQATELCEAANKAYEYNVDGYLVKTTDWDDVVTRYVRDERGLIKTLIEAEGTEDERITEFTYVDNFRLIDTITLGDRTVDRDYDPHGRLTKTTATDTQTGEVRTTLRSYYADTTSPTGLIMPGELHTIDGPRTNVDDIITITYDEQARVSKTTNALGQVTEIKEYDSANRPTLIVDQNTIPTRITYDSDGRILSSTKGLEDGLKATAEFDYYPNGLLKTTTLPNLAQVHYAYDDAQRLTTITDSLGNNISYTLDNTGNRKRTEFKDAEGTLRFYHQQSFDELSRLYQTVAANDDTVNMSYSKNNLLAEVTDGEQNKTQFAYDFLHRLETQTDADEYDTQITYDVFDNIATVTNARGNKTQYQRNALGDLKEELSQESGTTQFEHDSAGNVIEKIDARGVKAEFKYDALNRLIEVVYPQYPEQNIQYTYDEGDSCGFKIGKLCAVHYQGGATYYEYDELERIVRVIEQRGELSLTTDYAYDAAGMLSGMILPSGRSVSFERNANAQVSGVKATFNNDLQTLLSQIEYMPFGGVDSQVFGNGITLNNTYNEAYQLAERTHSGIISYDYSYDKAGNIIATDGKAYEYDNLYRLNYESNEGEFFSYIYDAIGNRLSKNEYSKETLYIYPQENQLLQSINSDEINFAITYEANGNTKTYKGMEFSYNASNRLSQLTNGNKLAQYFYDHRNLRFSKKLGEKVEVEVDAELQAQIEEKRGQVQNLQEVADQFEQELQSLTAQVSEAPTQADQQKLNHRLQRFISIAQKRFDHADEQLKAANDELIALEAQVSNDAAQATEFSQQIIYVYSLSGEIIGEYSKSGDLIREYIHANGEPLAQFDVSDTGNTESVVFIHTDHLATPRYATNISGEQVWHWQSDAFGVGLADGNTEVNLRFPGQYFDEESGLHYNWHRYYGPELGRYSRVDPIGLAGGLNVIAYATSNPVNLVDQTGLTAICPGTPPHQNANWIPYGGNPNAFHCGYDGFLENRIPNEVDPSPAAECFYDHEDNLCDENHKYAGCRGTADLYPWIPGNRSLSTFYNHWYNDPGGPHGPSLNPEFKNLEEESSSESRRFFRDHTISWCNKSPVGRKQCFSTIKVKEYSVPNKKFRRRRI